MKIDLHCHSKHSKRPSLWFMQKLGCPESFTEPGDLYRLLRQRGMDAVTITDHNVIDGCLEIAHLDNVFMGCEYTTYFPNGRCKVHVLVYGMTEAQHADMNKARENIFDLVSYVYDEDLFHVCAHPLFWVNDKLTLEHIEQLVLLFKNWEVNGDVCPEMNRAVRHLIHGLGQKDIERLADKHGITPPAPGMWDKNTTAGSDDHSSLNLGRACTEVYNAQTFPEFRAGVEHGLARTRCRAATPQMLGRNYYGIAYQFYRNRFGLERSVNKDVFLRFMDRSLRHAEDGAEPWLSRLHLRWAERRRPKEPSPGNMSLLALVRSEAERKIRTDPHLSSIVRAGTDEGTDLDRTWFEFVNHLGNRLLNHLGTRLIDRVVNARLFDVFHSLGSAGLLYLLLAPYFAALGLHARQRRWSEDVLEHFGTPRTGRRDEGVRVAHFTDTYRQVNGVARTIRQQLSLAQEQGKDYSVVVCQAAGCPGTKGLYQFAPVGSYVLPEYEELDVLIPPFLQMLQHCYEDEVTQIHVATPGPVGLAGLGIARILKVPVTGTYHTSFPQYAKALTDDRYMEDMAWRYMTWFYDQMDAVYVPSRFTGEELAEKGISREKIRVYPRGIDIEQYHPRHRDRDVFDAYGIPEGATIFLYVGRVSREKNLHVLVSAFRKLAAQGGNVWLVITGDGPFRQEMEGMLEGVPARFTGYKEGDELAALYASADVFVFPSTTDTFGNVVLEAQASGIPVIVAEGSAPAENVVPDTTGLVVEPNSSQALCDGMAALAGDASRRFGMGQAARACMDGRGFGEAFEKLWSMYSAENVRERQGTAPEPAAVDAERWLQASAL